MKGEGVALQEREKVNIEVVSLDLPGNSILPESSN